MKAVCGKTARTVWAADGGQRASAPPPTRHLESLTGNGVAGNLFPVIFSEDEKYLGTGSMQLISPLRRSSNEGTPTLLNPARADP